MMHHDSYGVGLQGEHLVICDLISLGFVAFQGQAGLPYDLILDIGDTLLRVQVKSSASPTPTKKNLYTFRVNPKTKANNKRSLHRVDLYAFVALGLNEIYYEWARDVVNITYNINLKNGHNRVKRGKDFFYKKKLKR